MKSKYVDLPPKQFNDWRDSFSVRILDTSGTPGLYLLEVTVDGRSFQLYPNEFNYLRSLLNAHPEFADDGEAIVL